MIPCRLGFANPELLDLDRAFTAFQPIELLQKSRLIVHDVTVRDRSCRKQSDSSGGPTLSRPPGDGPAPGRAHGERGIAVARPPELLQGEHGNAGEREGRGAAAMGASNVRDREDDARTAECGRQTDEETLIAEKHSTAPWRRGSHYKHLG